MTLESAFPWISAVSAVAAAFTPPQSRWTRSLRTCALAALALYAYFRWITPTSVPMALACLALGQATTPEGPARWRRWTIALPALGWLVLANLYRSTGDGVGVFVGDAAKAGLLAALVIGSAYGLRRTWRWTPEPHLGFVVEAVALLLMALTALTLDWDFWPVMTGALAVLASFALLLYAAGRSAGQRVLRAAWALSFVGEAAMAYAFLR